MREMREFATWLELVRDPKRAEGLATVSWFKLEGDLSLPLIVRAANEANSLLSADPVTSLPVTIVSCEAPLRVNTLADEAGRLHSERGNKLHLTVAVPPTGPILLIITVDNLACDSVSLHLLLDRLSQRCCGSAYEAVSVDCDRSISIPRFTSTLPAGELVERIESKRRIVKGTAWVRRNDLDHIIPVSKTVAPAESFSMSTLLLGAKFWERLASQRSQLSATPFVIAIGAWGALLSRLTASEEVAVIINTTGRQVEGYMREIGYFYDLGVLPIKMREGGTGEEYVREARRAILEHHSRYVPCGLLVKNIPEVSEALSNPRTLIIALQTKTEDPSGVRFGVGQRSAFKSKMSHGEAFSIPLDGLVTLTGEKDSFRLELEHRCSSISIGVAQSLLSDYASMLAAIVNNPRSVVAAEPTQPN